MQPARFNRISDGLLAGLPRGGFPLQIGLAAFSLFHLVVLFAHKNLYNADAFRLFMGL
jgi:hypothetical protein